MQGYTTLEWSIHEFVTHTHLFNLILIFLRKIRYLQTGKHKEMLLWIDVWRYVVVDKQVWRDVVLDRQVWRYIVVVDKQVWRYIVVDS